MEKFVDCRSAKSCHDTENYSTDFPYYDSLKPYMADMKIQIIFTY
jgi:hypothetical protein